MLLVTSKSELILANGTLFTDMHLLKRDDMIYEYIGDVVSHPSFTKRMRQYAEEGIRHFYFMMLQKDEVNWLVITNMLFTAHFFHLTVYRRYEARRHRPFSESQLCSQLLRGEMDRWESCSDGDLRKPQYTETRGAYFQLQCGPLRVCRFTSRLDACSFICLQT